MEFRQADIHDIPLLGIHAYHVIEAGGYQHPLPERITETVLDSVYGGNAYVVIQGGQVVGSMCVRWHVGVFACKTAELFNLWMEKGLPARSVHQFTAWVCRKCRYQGAQQFLIVEASGSPHKPFENLGFREVAVLRMGEAGDVLKELEERS